MSESIRVKLEVAISASRISDLLCCALEGGSNYWYVIESHKIEPGAKLETVQDAGREYMAHLDLPFIPGCGLIIRTLEGDQFAGKTEWTLDTPAIERGLNILAAKYPHHMSEFFRENEDADTGDAFLQCCLFGEVVFG